jgi:hypothetical protein
MSGANNAQLRRLRTHRLIRQLHLWIGAWGAIAAILFGATGFMQNHRGILKLPQGDSSEVSRSDLPVPVAARGTPEALLEWLRDSQHLSLESQRAQRARWTFMGGNARITTQAEYTVGSDSISIRTSQQSPLAVLSRLHKGVGGGIAWILLTDSFAVAMVALGISGLLLWGRGRSLRQMIFSIAGAALLGLLLIGGAACGII